MANYRGFGFVMAKFSVNFTRDLRLHRRMVSTKTQVSSVVLGSTYVDDVGIDDDGASAVVSVGGGGGVW